MQSRTSLVVLMLGMLVGISGLVLDAKANPDLFFAFKWPHYSSDQDAGDTKIDAYFRVLMSNYPIAALNNVNQVDLILSEFAVINELYEKMQEKKKTSDPLYDFIGTKINLNDLLDDLHDIINIYNLYEQELNSGNKEKYFQDLQKKIEKARKKHYTIDQLFLVFFPDLNFKWEGWCVDLYKPIHEYPPYVYRIPPSTPAFPHLKLYRSLIVSPFGFLSSNETLDFVSCPKNLLKINYLADQYYKDGAKSLNNGIPIPWPLVQRVIWALIYCNNDPGWHPTYPGIPGKTDQEGFLGHFWWNADNTQNVKDIIQELTKTNWFWNHQNILLYDLIGILADTGAEEQPPLIMVCPVVYVFLQILGYLN